MRRLSLHIFLLVLCSLLAFPLGARKYVFHMEDYGIRPGEFDLTPLVEKFLREHQPKFTPEDRVVLRFQPGTYHFHSREACERETYISNHDQWQPRRIVFDFRGWHNLTIDGGGALFIFHGIVVPLALSHSSDCTLRNFSIDYARPRMTPLEILESDTLRGITFRVPEWADCTTHDDRFQTADEGIREYPVCGMAFDTATSHLVYRAGEFEIDTRGVRRLDDRTFAAPRWRNATLRPGMVVAARTWSRPTPAIFLDECKRTKVKDIRVHYAYGMGLLAQRCEDVTLKGFSVCLRDKSRYATTHADATHFSQCKGRIVSTHGLYEGMMDDAINVHGVYLRVRERLDDHTLLCAFEHEQAYGFNWGNTGDSVQFIRSRTMETFGKNTIAAIRPHDRRELCGMRVFRIEFAEALPPEVSAEGEGIGLENLTWHPEVVFSHNIVRNNRARGALFSSPRRTVCERNLFDHVSGSAILLCGDCNGWYESGACRDLVIRKNKFVNCLTNYFQFTNAVISIYPEIPDLEAQQQYFHRNIRIEDNEFVYFDRPLLYAKSVDGLVFRRNRIKSSDEFAPFHWNTEPIRLEHVRGAQISDY